MQKIEGADRRTNRRIVNDDSGQGERDGGEDPVDEVEEDARCSAGWHFLEDPVEEGGGD